MGNRSALILSPGPGSAAEEQPSFAFEGNNFVPLFWFAAFPAESVEGWEAAWHAHLAAVERDEPLPDTILWTSWPEARERLAALSAYLGQMHRKPGWARLFQNWLAALNELAEARQAQWLGMHLSEIFAFHEDPQAMVQDTLAGIALWQGIPDLPEPQHPRELTGDPADPLIAAYFSPEQAPAPRPPRRLRLSDWLALPAMAVVLGGIWVYSQSILYTLLALAILAAAVYWRLRS
ncbi:hypothetical protein IAI18_03535 [Acetobacteraceae bacterium H6797]|nr:hypothetical protein [Acetobacteraceae bacterium H6797]